jgi:hypothetical protein
MSSRIQSAFSCDLLSTLGNDANYLRFHLQRERDNLRRVRHFEIQASLNDLTQSRDVSILHVTAIFAQMRSDAMAPRRFADNRRSNRIRLTFRESAIPRFPQRGNVVNVYAEFQHSLESCRDSRSTI